MWIYCSFSKLTKSWHHSCVFSQHKPKQRNYELTYMKILIRQIIQSFEFCQPSAFSYPTSSSLIPKGPSPSWIYWHFIIKHNPFLVCNLLKCWSPLLNDFETCLKKFNANFRDSNKKHTSINKLQPFHQGSH